MCIEYISSDTQNTCLSQGYLKRGAVFKRKRDIWRAKKDIFGRAFFSWPIRPAGEIYNAKGLTLLILRLISSVSAQNGLYATDKMQVLCTHKQKRHC
jgi:hypothetical protein